MRHKCPINEPEIRLFTIPGPKSHPSQPLVMSHGETFMSHRETSDAAANPPEIRLKTGNARGNSKNGRKRPLWRRGEAQIRAPCRDRAETGAQMRTWTGFPFFVPLWANASVGRLKVRGFLTLSRRSLLLHEDAGISATFSDLALDARSDRLRDVPHGT